MDHGVLIFGVIGFAVTTGYLKIKSLLERIADRHETKAVDSEVKP